MHDLGLKTSIQNFDTFVGYTLMGNQPWPQFQNGIRERSIKLPVMINLGQISCLQSDMENGLSDMENVCRTGKVSRRLRLLKRKFLRRLAMLYGVANKPLNLTTIPLPSVQVCFAMIFENFTQNHAWYLLKNLPQTCPRPLKTFPESAPDLVYKN